LALKYLRDQRHTGTIHEIVKLKFPFPNDEHPDLETIVNEPEPRISVGNWQGRDLFPDIVVVKKPGQWLQLMAEVETADTVNDEEAEREWKPYGNVGELLLYVPAGYAGKAKDLCKKHGVRLAGIRTWRFRPVWGLEVVDVT
jgi:hypothetical protein